MRRLPRLPRALAPAVALGVAVVPAITTAGVPQAAAAPFATRQCGTSANTKLLDRKPAVTKLPGGAQLRVWDARHSNGGSGYRLSEVYVPRSSGLKLHILTSGAVRKEEKPTAALRAHKKMVAITNGDVFFPSMGGVPQGQEVLAGHVTKADSSPENVLAISKTGVLRGGMLKASGSVTASGKHAKITGVNWQSVTGKGVNVYTDAWGTKSRPHGSVDVVVRNGKVAAKRHSGLGQGVSRGTEILTGNGSAANFLNGLKVGKPITVSPSFYFKVHYGEKNIRVYDAINHDAPWLLQGKRWPLQCNAKNSEHLARTGIGWDRKGDIMLITVSGPNYGRISGGTTAYNMEDIFKKLGAYNADGYDCDTSTTMAVRLKPGGRPVREDHTAGHYERPVPNYLAIGP